MPRPRMTVKMNLAQPAPRILVRDCQVWPSSGELWKPSPRALDRRTQRSARVGSLLLTWSQISNRCKRSRACHTKCLQFFPHPTTPDPDSPPIPTSWISKQVQSSYDSAKEMTESRFEPAAHFCHYDVILPVGQQRVTEGY